MTAATQINAVHSTAAVNVDLLRERQVATISSEDFAEWWAGGRTALQQRRALEQRFFEDAEFEDQQNIAYMSHKELYEHTVSKASKFLIALRQWQRQQEQAGQEQKKSTIELMYDFRMLLTSSLGMALFQQSFPLRLHFSMFMPALLGQCTAAQHEQWLERAWRMDGIIGTYAQTELGHGTYIRGLETRADYDEQSDEFILNTPSLSAYKWWPGGIGHTANVVVLIAQLYIRGKHYGLQPFLVRIRNEQTHAPEPGVDVGEIGPKIGNNGVNNGFLGLKNVRIPRTQMLMKHAQVLEGGKFVKGPEPLLIYGTMVYVRVMIVSDVAFNLLLAATIATRYSAVRRQSPIAEGQQEPQIMDHITQQAKLFPQIAKGIFYRIAADVMWRMYRVIVEQLDAGDRRNLPELHALSCCLKAYCSHTVEDGIETLRKSCGGAGYLCSSNFPQIYGIATAACTYEGENTVLLLQTARFLVKQYKDGLQRKVLPQSVTYLRNAARPKWSKELSTLVRHLEIAATEKVRQVFDYQRALRMQQKSAKSARVANRMTGIRETEAATLHARAFLARIAIEEMQQLKRQLKPALADVLVQLLELFVLEMWLQSVGDILLAYPLVTAQQCAEIQTRYETVLTALRPNAIAVVDGFDFHDRVLGSTLGCYDGRVYERLMEEARKSPLNKQPVNETCREHLRALMQSKL